MIFSYLLNMQSHPSWVCGLKPSNGVITLEPTWSHPSWVCGLKHLGNVFTSLVRTSHPSWVCGLKHALIKQVVPVQCHTLRGCVD